MDGCRVRAIGTKSSIEDMDSELAAEWRIVNTRREDENQFQKTAKDRWSLTKLVYKIGMNKTKKHGDDGWWITDRDACVVNRKSKYHIYTLTTSLRFIYGYNFITNALI